MRKIQPTLLFILASFLTYAQDSLEPAKKKLKAGDFSGAKSDLTKILDTNPKNKEALNLRGEARAGLSDFYGAISDYTYALEVDSTFAIALNNRGEAKLNLGDDESSIADFNKAIRFNPAL